ncbi:hypothetical protein SNEBB_008817 [Seison nebaliae]|nr:hypothetical protein SNEBB_008817 [Seison nebaliae]
MSRNDETFALLCDRFDSVQQEQMYMRNGVFHRLKMERMKSWKKALNNIADRRKNRTTTDSFNLVDEQYSREAHLSTGDSSKDGNSSSSDDEEKKEKMKEIDADDLIAEAPCRQPNQTDEELKKMKQYEIEELMKITEEDKAGLYVEALYTIIHKIGIREHSHEKLINYLHDIFKMDDDTHHLLLHQAEKQEAPRVIINVDIFEAKNLEAKDANGFSDPYCMLGIMPKQLLNENNGHKNKNDGSVNSFLHRFGESLKFRPKKPEGKRTEYSERRSSFVIRDRLPARYIQTTDVKRCTLNPVWNQRFRFFIEDLETDTLHLDIWDHDDEVSVLDATKRLNEISGIKGLNRFFKQVAQSARTSSSVNNQRRSSLNVDDFLGCLDLSLATVSSKGVEKWYKLQGRSSKSKVDGDIRLRLSLSTREKKNLHCPHHNESSCSESDEDCNWTDVDEQRKLLRIFIEAEIGKEDSNHWNGQLSHDAEVILHQHAVQGDITDLQLSLCRWLSYSDVHQKKPLNFNILGRLLRSLDELSDINSPLSRDETVALRSSFQLYIINCCSLIRHLREVLPATCEPSIYKLQAMLSTLSRIHSMQLYQIACSPYICEDMHDLIYEAIDKGLCEWYETTKAASKPLMRADEQIILSLVKLVNAIYAECFEAAKVYDKHFKKYLNISYFSFIYKKLDEKLCTDILRALEAEIGNEIYDDIEEVINREEDILDNSVAAVQIGENLFRLYTALKDFHKFRTHVTGIAISTLHINSFHKYFVTAVRRWIDLARQKSMQRIKISVEQDQSLDYENEVQLTTSSVDVKSFLAEYRQFWAAISWPDAEYGFIYLMKITQDLTDAAMYYTNLMHQKMLNNKYYDSTGRFDISKELCQIINSIENVRDYLVTNIPQNLEVNKTVTQIDEMSAEGCKIALNKSVMTMNQEMQLHIKEILTLVVNKMSDELNNRIFQMLDGVHELTMNSTVTDKLSEDEVLHPLIQYIEDNLISLKIYMLQVNFNLILFILWKDFLQIFENNFKKVSKKTSPLTYFMKCKRILETLANYFHGDGNGLSRKDIENSRYIMLTSNISLHVCDSSTLISMFYKERVLFQQSVCESLYGSVTVRAQYHTSAETLSVELLFARNLRPMDANGSSDPFVLISLKPAFLFTTKTVHKSKVKKKTLNPQYNERFDFKVKEVECLTDGASIEFRIFDHDLVGRDDFEGEAYLSVNNLPGVHGDLGPGGLSDLKTTTLYLQHPKEYADGIIDVLRKRDDQLALNFVADFDRIRLYD